MLFAHLLLVELRIRERGTFEFKQVVLEDMTVKGLETIFQSELGKPGHELYEIWSLWHRFQIDDDEDVRLKLYPHIELEAIFISFDRKHP